MPPWVIVCDHDQSNLFVHRLVNYRCISNANNMERIDYQCFLSPKRMDGIEDVKPPFVGNTFQFPTENSARLECIHRVFCECPLHPLIGKEHTKQQK